MYVVLFRGITYVPVGKSVWTPLGLERAVLKRDDRNVLKIVLLLDECFAVLKIDFGAKQC